MTQQFSKSEIPMDPVEARRAKSGAFIRFIYALGVISLGVYLIWTVGRSMLFLEGPGYVTAPKYLASTPYLSKVVHMNVSTGIPVEMGDTLAFLTSPQIEREKTELLRLQLEQANREGELKIRLQIASATLLASQDRLRLANDAFGRSDNSTAVSTSYKMEVSRERSQAILLNAQSEAEIAEIRLQLNRIHEHLTEIDSRLRNLDLDFAKGVITSPVNGVIGLDVAHDGQIIAPGKTIAEIYDVQESYIDWHVPSFRVFSPRLGDLVFIYYGNSLRSGYISEILNLAEVDRSQNESFLKNPKITQIVRVRPLRGSTSIPLNAEVTVRMNYFDFVDASLGKLQGWLK